MARTELRNQARQFRCRTRTCAPSGEAKALIASKLGARGKSASKGYEDILLLIEQMKESNVWKNNVKGFLFKGDIPTGMRSRITSFATSNGWMVTLGKRIVKYGTILRGGRLNRRHLLIFGYYRGNRGKVYCSLTII